MTVAPELEAYTGFLVRALQQVHLDLWAAGAPFGVTGIQFGVLTLVEAHPGIDQKSLGELLQLDRSTIADLVARLQRQGYLERIPDVADRRRRLLTLTRAGRDALTPLRAHAEDINARLIATLAPEEQAQLRRILTTLLSAREDAPVEPAP
ncbi:MarR family winged helix-turn-helix transcriptional regulator [Salinibacterium sp. ZJ450]|uniref:MarR family winged helix-turn-helix transcriptional regulator n=1 Tax=Salinibacterium sp. ZJ450 TaxID=2708338 RepID=UPI00141DC709|nr:MarR family winged helix-turn-helix transcriptional regulator [Salinibacterium sp. ZJ450]